MNVCKRNEMHILSAVPFYLQCESMGNLAGHTFVLVNARLGLHIHAQK